MSRDQPQKGHVHGLSRSCRFQVGDGGSDARRVQTLFVCPVLEARREIDVTSYDRSNVFARILRGELPSTTLYEDALVKVILDILPVNPGHLLVLPKAEAALFGQLTEEHVAAMFRVAQRMDRALRQSGILCEGVNLWLSDGESAGQEVPHVHLHVIPRFAGDGFRFRMGPANRRPLAKERAEELAQSLKAVL